MKDVLFWLVMWPVILVGMAYRMVKLALKMGALVIDTMIGG